MLYLANNCFAELDKTQLGCMCTIVLIVYEGDMLPTITSREWLFIKHKEALLFSSYSRIGTVTVLY